MSSSNLPPSMGVHRHFQEFPLPVSAEKNCLISIYKGITGRHNPEIFLCNFFLFMIFLHIKSPAATCLGPLCLHFIINNYTLLYQSPQKKTYQKIRLNFYSISDMKIFTLSSETRIGASPRKDKVCKFIWSETGYPNPKPLLFFGGITVTCRIAAIRLYST